MARTNKTEKHDKTGTGPANRPRRGSTGSRKRARSSQQTGGSERFWTRCPRCGMGLVQTLSGAVQMERCTNCGGLWESREDVVRLASWDTTGWFSPFREC